MAGKQISYRDAEVLLGGINSPRESAARDRLVSKLRKQGYKLDKRGNPARGQSYQRTEPNPGASGWKSSEAHNKVRGKSKLTRAMAKVKGGKANAGGGGG
jgi:hypothetical protein